MSEIKPKNPVGRPRQQITDKQKAARVANLAAGRQVRKEKLEKKKQMLHPEEYDISSYDGSDDESDSDSDAFIISKAQRKKSVKPSKLSNQRSKEKGIIDTRQSNGLKEDVDELKKMMMLMAKEHKKQKNKSKERKSGGTKIVVLPQPTPQVSQVKAYTDSSLDALRKSLGML